MARRHCIRLLKMVTSKLRSFWLNQVPTLTRPVLATTRHCISAICAAIDGEQAVLEYIIVKAALSPQERTDALEVLAADLVTRVNSDFPAAIKIWRQCLEDRKRYGLNLFTKKETRSNLMHPWKAYENLQEIESVLNGKDEGEIRNYAVFIVHQILGSSHRNTINSTQLLGAFYGDKKQYDRCLEFWLYAITVQMSQLHSPLMKVEIILSKLMFFLKVFIQIFTEEDDVTCVGTAMTIFQHCLTVLDYLTLQTLSHLSIAAATSPTSPDEESITENYNRTLEIAVVFICLLCLLQSFMTTEEKRQRDVLVSKLVSANHRVSNKSTILHVACLKETYKDFMPLDAVPILDMVTLLFSFKQANGRMLLLSPTIVDDSGNTALHVIAKVIIDPTTSVETKWEFADAGKVLVRH